MEKSLGYCKNKMKNQKQELLLLLLLLLLSRFSRIQLCATP